MSRKRKPQPALTGSVSELIDDYIASDPAFREALIQEAIEAMLAGDVETGKTIMRDYIKATDGFEKLGRALGTPAKSLIRMFGAARQPTGAQSVRRHRLSAKARRAQPARDQ